MKSRKKLSYFLAGMLTAFLLISLVTPALASSVMKQIEVLTGVSIYVDDKKLDPKDANGNPVDVFIYNGTTYLPVRAICDALGVSVQWEESTQSVYLGGHPTESTANQEFLQGKPAKDKFDEKTNKKYSIGNITFSIPTYYGNEQKTDSHIDLYTEQSGKGIPVMLAMSSYDLDLLTYSPKERLDFEVQTMIQVLQDSDAVEDFNLYDVTDVVVAGLPAQLVRFSYELLVNEEVYKIYYEFALIANANKNEMVSIWLSQTDIAQYNYFPDFNKILESATIASNGQSNTGKSPATNSPSGSNTPSAGSNSQTTKPTGTATQNQSRTVYVTPTGKRYHYSSSCNGGTYSPTTLEAAIRSGLTPCEKCVK